MKSLLLSLSLLFLLACGSPSNSDGLPTITMITPASGPIAGGSDATITGTNFDASTQTLTVRFGNNPATVKSASASQVLVTVPPTGVPGMVDVVVTNGSSGLSAILTGGFSYLGPALTLIAGGLGGIGNVDGTRAAARFNTPLSVALDGAGNLYIADSSNHIIRKVVVATGVVTTLAGTAGVTGSNDGAGPTARFNFPDGAAVDGAGNLYVADGNNHTIRKVVVATGVVTTLAGTASLSGGTDGIGPTARFNKPKGVAVDGTGNLYVADNNNHTIRKVVVATGAVTTLAGAAGMFGSMDGIGSVARFNFPNGVAVDSSGNLYVSETANRTVRKVVVATSVVSTLAGTAGVSGSTDGTGPAARFNFPGGVAVDGTGNLYVADTSNHTIRKVAVTTGVVTTIAGSALSLGRDDGTGPAARFNFPGGVAVDGAGTLYVADSGNHTIRKVTVTTGVVTTIAGSALSLGSVDGTGSAARFNKPIGIAADRIGNLYVADSGNHTIRKVIAATGELTTIAGTVGVSGSADGTGSTARFNTPEGVAADGAGNLYVADSLNHTIRKVVVATGEVTTLAGIPGVPGINDGRWINARFQLPIGVAVDRAGSLYVADSANSTIRKVVVATGVVTTVAGTAGMRGSTDGTGPAARFNFPDGVAVDDASNLYVADTSNHTIRKVMVSTGEVTTLAGAASIVGSTDGTGAARFNGPVAVAVDDAGNLYVADSANGTIRKVVVATGNVSTIVGVPGQKGVVLGALPAGLSQPVGLAVLPSGDLFVSDVAEHNILAIR